MEQDGYRPLPTHPGRRLAGEKDVLPQQAPGRGALSTLSTMLRLKPAAARTTSTARPSLLERRRGDVGTLFSFGDAPFERPVWLTSEKQFGKRPASARLEESDADLPESPLGLPGAWVDEHDDRRALMLPPPFLDGRSTRESLGGVLGTKRERVALSRAKKAQRALARDRPPPPAFPHSLFATASKLVNALGPPGGLDSGPFYRSWKDDPDADALRGRERKERRRVDRAERGLKGFEIGELLAQRLAGRLRRVHPLVATVGGGNVTPDPTAAESGFAPDKTPALVAATPMSLLRFPPSPTSPSFPFISDYMSTSLGTTLVDEPPFSLEPFSLRTPDRPSLRPMTSALDSEPSPLPLIPLDLKAAARLEEDYFGIPLLRKKSEPPVLTASEPAPGHRGLRSSTVLSASATVDSSNSAFLVTLGAPISYAFGVLSSRARAHFDLFVWILVGSPAMTNNAFDSVGGVVGVILHLFGFSTFLLVHVWELAFSAYATARSCLFFLHWTFLNLTGRTDLSIVASEYFRLCRTEWDAVAAEDGVALGLWSVGVGLLELCAIQAMSKDRWLNEGPGRLVLLNGADSEEIPPLLFSTSPHRRTRSTKRPTALDRPELGRRKTTHRWEEDAGEGDSLLVTGGTGGKDSILEGEVLSDNFDPATYASPATAPVACTDDDNDDDDLPELDLNAAAAAGMSFTTVPPTPLFKVPSSPPLHPLPAPAQPLPALLKLLKRHARLATASYGLHSYIVDPVFSPSGEKLSQGVFGHLGGVERHNVLHVAIQRHYSGVPAATVEAEDAYAPQFYLLRDDANGEIVVVVRGTQSLADIRTDLEASMEEVQLPALRGGGRETFKVHAGILAAARRLLDPEQSVLFAKLKSVLQDHDGYAVVFCGHSLGAALASTLALLVAQYTPAPLGGDTTPSSSSSGSFNDKGHWTTTSTCGLPADRACRAICFAHPTTVDPRLGRRCALGTEPLVLSVSFSSDLVTRMGVSQVREVRRALGRLAQRRRKFLKRRQAGEHGVSEVLSSWWRWKQLGGGEVEEQDKTPEHHEIEGKAWAWRREVDGLLDDATALRRETHATVPAGKLFHIDRLPRQLEHRRREEVESLLDEEEDEEDPQVWGLYEVGESEPFAAMPMLDGDMVKSHLPREYLDAIDSL